MTVKERSPAALVAAVLPPAGAQRLFVLISFVTSIGAGLYVSGSAVYFVAYVGLSAPQFGLGLSIAGAVSLVGGVPIGHLADRLGAKATTIVLSGFQAGLLVLATAVSEFWMFLLTVVLLGTAQAGANISRNALITSIVEGPQRVKLSAHSRSALNAGFSLGVLGAGVAIGFHSRTGYLTLIWTTAVISLIACLMHLWLPAGANTASGKAPARMTTALRDLPYMLVAQVTGLTRLGETILTIGLPLWVITHTTAPRQLAAWLIVINTVIVVLFQVRAARSATTVGGAMRLQGWAYVALIVTCVIIGISSDIPAWTAVAALIGATLALTVAEMWGEAARWALRYELAPHDAHGQYGGVFALGTAVPSVVGPLLVTSLTDRYELLGWLVIGLVFLIGLSASRRAIAWAARTRTSPVTASS